MPPAPSHHPRPLLGVRRATLRAACDALDLPPWDDPHNADPAYARARVRHQALPALETALGPGVAQALARTAGQLRTDAEALDELAAGQVPLLRDPDGGWLAGALAAAPTAIRARVLRMAAIEAGCPPGKLTAGHVEALDELVTHWHGQRWATLPGGVRAMLRCGKLTFAVNVRHAPDEAEAMVGRD